MRKSDIQPSSAHPTTGYTHGVLTHSGLLFIAGQVAKNPSDTTVGPGDMAAQAVQVFENIGAVLAEAGGGFQDLVKINIYMTDARLLGPFRDARDQYMKDVNPASTLVVVAALADPGWMLEVEAVADLGDR